MKVHLDDYVYMILNKYISPFLCFLKPDHVSLIRIIPILIMYKAILEKNKILLFSSMLISITLDLLDGSVARKCKKTSKFGGELDLFMDLIHHVLVYYYIINLYFPNIKHKWMIILLIIFIMLLFTKYVFVLDHEHKPKNFKDIYEFLSNNTVLKGIIEFYMIQHKF